MIDAENEARARRSPRTLHCMEAGVKLEIEVPAGKNDTIREVLPGDKEKLFTVKAD